MGHMITYLFLECAPEVSTVLSAHLELDLRVLVIASRSGFILPRNILTENEQRSVAHVNIISHLYNIQRSVNHTHLLAFVLYSRVVDLGVSDLAARTLDRRHCFIHMEQIQRYVPTGSDRVQPHL